MTTFSLLIAACAPYQALKSPNSTGQGYSETFKDNDVISLRYQGNTNQTLAVISNFWQRRANELCINGFTIIYKKEHIIHGFIRTPVNGLMVTLGTQKPLITALIKCK